MKTEKHAIPRRSVYISSKKLRIGLNPISWKIMELIDKEPNYPKEIAKRMKMHEQKIYYHVHNLEKAGMIKVLKYEKIRGSLSKYYVPTGNSFVLELEKSSRPTEEIKNDYKKSDSIKRFFHEYIDKDLFEGSIVVGSPTPHGPFLTEARDGHYAVQLGMFLGGFCSLRDRFIVKLDTEVKGEKSMDRNLIVLGGPITNMISSEINSKLKIKFKYEKIWKIYSEISNKEYSNEDVGIIAKIKNPWDRSKTIIFIAGLKYESTKTCIIALTQNFGKLLEDYASGEFYSLIRGHDKDGDGKIDSIEIIEKY